MEHPIRIRRILISTVVLLTCFAAVFSQTPHEFDKAMDEAIKYFAAQDYKKALEEYQSAAKLKPDNYEANLFTGNTYYALKDYENAGVWFAKAIAINPNRETAYRYWADGLFRSGKHKEAEEKYFDAIIAEPYSQFSWKGLAQYGQLRNLPLAHAKIDVPVNFEASSNGDTKITLGIGSADSKDGSFAWTVYGMSRALWQTDKDGKLSKEFAKAYPNEKTYRHSLAEEVHALTSVLSVLRESKDVKNPQPSLVMLKRIHDEGLLESYILFVKADEGISKDYAVYRQSNRDKLRMYLTNYVMKNGGN